MPGQDKLFLAASIDSSDALTELFDFVWPTAVGIWNLQWQAKGFVAQLPSLSVTELDARFVPGSGIQGANIKRLATETTWAQMQQWFARLLLSESCALFEGWIEAALDELKIPQAIRQIRRNHPIDKELQFPSTRNASGVCTNGLTFALDRVRGATGSKLIQTCFHPTQLQNKKLSLTVIEDLLICYRAFKDVRNDFTHHGGRASQKAAQSYIEYSALTASLMNVKEKPALPSVVAGDPIQLSLRGVVGFSDVVIRLIATLDFALSDSSYAEELLKKRWIASHKGMVTVKANARAREVQLIKLIKQCGLPRPVDMTTLYTHLRSQKLAV
jgi:hypothetical protein